MSTFILRLWHSESHPVGKAAILDALRHRSWFKEPVVEDGLIQIDYVHPNTRTLFAITYMAPGPESEEDSAAPSGFLRSGLEFHMELPNSSWTAREAFSEVSSVARSFRLVIQDVDASRGMQSENGKPAPPYLMPDNGIEEELLRRWNRSCRHEIAYLAMTGVKVPYVPEELVRRWWEFSSVEHLLRGQVGSHTKVLPMFIAEHPETKVPVTGMPWPAGSAVVIAPCDAFLIVQSPSGFLSRLLGRAQVSLVPYEEVMTRLENFLRPFEGPPPLKGLRMMTSEESLSAKSAFAAIQGRRINPNYLRYLHEETFSDIALPE